MNVEIYVGSWKLLNNIHELTVIFQSGWGGWRLLRFTNRTEKAHRHIEENENETGTTAEILAPSKILQVRNFPGVEEWLCFIEDKDEFWEDYQYATETDCQRDNIQNKQRTSKSRGCKYTNFQNDSEMMWRLNYWWCTDVLADMGRF